jgi:hypothetical protein
MNPLPTFATAEFPLRASALPSLLKCPLRAALFHLDLLADDSGPAAHTGNLTHEAVDHWHKHKDYDAAVVHMNLCREKFPKGEISEAEKYFRPYAHDPRNADAEVVACELKVNFKIDAAEGDEGGPIYVRGTLDQIRKEDGRLTLWDLKTGDKMTGWQMLHDYAAQQAAYCIAACEVLGQPVYPGGIIRAYGYRVRDAKPPSPPGVFFHSPWDIADCHVILADVRNRVLQVRRGEAVPVSGRHCDWCPADGLQGCLPMLRKLR